MRSSKVPSGLTGFWSVSAVALAEREVVLAEGERVWTMPVPSSVVTKSAASTVWPRSPKSGT